MQAILTNIAGPYEAFLRNTKRLYWQGPQPNKFNVYSNTAETCKENGVDSMTVGIDYVRIGINPYNFDDILDAAGVSAGCGRARRVRDISDRT